MHSLSRGGASKTWTHKFKSLTRPQLALVVWLLSMTMVPIWFSVHIFATVPIYCIVAVIAVVVATIDSVHRVEFTPFDAYLIFIVVLAAVAVDVANRAFWAEMAIRWLVPFLAIRILAPAAGIQFSVDALSLILALVGVFATLEFLLSWHPFIDWSVGWNPNTTEFETWHLIQTRAGADRSAWTFGHSIALGGSLALSIPFIARGSFRASWKALMLVAVGAGIITTASRGAMLAAALTGGLCLAYAARHYAVRMTALLMAPAAALLVAPYISPIFEAWIAGASTEEQASASHRDYLYSTYAPIIQWFGRAPSYFGGAGTESVDSTVLHVGLNFGWIIVAMLAFPMVGVLVRVVAGRASTAELALAGQLPLFATVALITQYESFVFIVAGLAVQSVISERTVEPTPTGSHKATVAYAA